ncbi:MAG: diaminopimelate decarboxylase [Clostridia bacterium]|nr:diaminopimelate decarboxylase [Clostridia bacterium]
MLHDNVTVGENGTLRFAGVDTAAMAKKYGTPLYLMDADLIRTRVALYQNEMKAAFGGESRPLFAGKAFCTKAIYRIMAECGMSVDLVSPGELFTARSAGFPMERAFFHGNNKTDADIATALDSGVGCFVSDSREELLALDRIAGERGVCQKILLRVTPGIDPHTFAAVTTGKVDSKFGSPIATGAALDLTKLALSLPHINLVGFHCHIGSQIFDVLPFVDAADVMLRFTAAVRDATGFVAGVLNLGGGFGVRYTESDPEFDYAAAIHTLAAAVKRDAEALGLPLPTVLMEPGRSIVADAGMTLYTVGTVKEIPGFRTYVSVDGGMPDNPRYALYRSVYTVVNATHADRAPDRAVTVAGRCCESGDLIAEGARVATPERGDLVAVLVTGAYNYSMASNYNRIPRPPVVFLSKGKDALAVRRESYEDLVRNDL